MCLILGGCGTNQNVFESGMNPEGTSVDIFSNAVDISGYYEIDTGTVILPEPEFTYQRKEELNAYFQNTRYTLVCYEQVQGRRYMLIKDKAGADKIVLEPSALSELPLGDVVCFDSVSESDFAVLYAVKSLEAVEGRKYLLLHLDGEGNLLSQLEFTESYAEQQITQDELQHGNWWCDADGNNYVLDGGRKQIHIFDAQGKFLIQQDYSKDKDVTVQAAFHALDGSLVFALSDPGNRSTKLIGVDWIQKQMKELVSVEEPYLRQFNQLEDNQLYFLFGNKLWRCDMTTGGRTELYDLTGGAIPNTISEYVEQVCITEQGDIMLYVRKQDSVEYYLLSQEVPEQEEGIRLVDLIGQSYVNSCVTNYNREHEGLQIQYSRASGEGDADWTRLMAELVSGKGPDMICLWSSEQELQTLYEKGVLMDLTDMLPEETMEQIFRGIIEVGTKDEQLIGICPEAMPMALITADQIWEADRWNSQDILEIIDRNPQLEGIYTVEGQQNPIQTLSFMCLGASENIFYCNMEEGESRFEDVNFIRSVELAKKYGEMPGCTEEELVENIKSGKYLAISIDMNSPGKFAETMRKYDEDCHFIGFPGQENYVGYWGSTYLVVVNKQTQYREEIKQFLSELISFENQSTLMHTSVREDVVRSCICWADWVGDGVWQYKIGQAYYDFYDADGNCYIEDYVDFLSKLGPWPQDSPIEDIVLEEAKTYFNSASDLEHTVNVIDSRVQLYLDEIH